LDANRPSGGLERGATRRCRQVYIVIPSRPPQSLMARQGPGKLVGGSPVVGAVLGIAVGVLLVAAVLALPTPANSRTGHGGLSSKVEFDPEFLPHILTSPGVTEGGRFGSSVALSGSTLVLGAPLDYGAPADGRAYIENATTGSVVPLDAPLCCDFGRSVAIGGGVVVVRP